nr:uncharacterized protein LOC124814150 [Hydra vulgaris]
MRHKSLNTVIKFIKVVFHPFSKMISIIIYFVLLQATFTLAQKCPSGLVFLKNHGSGAIICDNGKPDTYSFIREGTIDKCPTSISKYDNSVITCTNQKVTLYWLAIAIQPRYNIYAFYPQFQQVIWR